ncbi:energy-coupling factor transporter transmembrane protein EcfT [Nocardiopsis sp. EMB25]|uniref:energy-coupling factor transporter transmembrane component T family protein n=1 Tax=Nocardiopsis sp. EMB25 TaxID=2835867 RepID=UPI0022840E34|nr:energy-coupling factor transporter transmembrane component T [Nocardiopsis sp. EMB25]MCY9785044.1 energy-coupling factor transporter transmembrane protein EcfT [Nocardiopsis sp. EMB25]
MRRERDRLSVEWVKLELLRTAYATRGGLLAGRDPRVVIGWYLILAVVPWFTHNVTVLAGLFAVCAAAVVLSRVGPLILGLFVIGFVLEGLYVLFAAWLFGGDASTVLAMAEFTLKLATVSLASMAAFVSLDPEKLSDALLSLHAPAMVSFGVSYGYRMLPVLMEEFHTVVDGHRLRAAPLASKGFLGWRVAVRTATTLVAAFYPLMLNTAKRTRTTVEALETRGFTYAAEHPDGRRIRLAALRADRWDALFLGATLALVAVCFTVGRAFPLLGGAV